MSKTIVFVENYEPLREIFATDVPAYWQAQGLDMETEVVSSVSDLTKLVREEAFRAACVVVDIEPKLWNDILEWREFHNVSVPFLVLTDQSYEGRLSADLRAELEGKGLHLHAKPTSLRALVEAIGEIVQIPCDKPGKEL